MEGIGRYWKVVEGCEKYLKVLENIEKINTTTHKDNSYYA